MSLRPALLVGLVFAVGGCLTRSLPIPPPSATIQSITQCPVIDCPMGGVTVVLTGNNALPNATVTALDEEAPGLPPGEILGGFARVTAGVPWTITIAPRRVGASTVVAVQRGHRLRVFQVTEDGEGSQSFYLDVPRM